MKFSANRIEIKSPEDIVPIYKASTNNKKPTIIDIEIDYSNNLDLSYKKST